MGILDFLLNKNKKDEKNEETNFSKPVESDKLSNDFINLDPYIEIKNDQEIKLLSILATSIASGDSPESTFVVKKVLKRNPEVKKITIIAASIAAMDSDEVSLVVKNIKKRKEHCNVEKI